MKKLKINLLPTATRFQLSQIKLARRLKLAAYSMLGFWLVAAAALLSLKFFLNYQKQRLIGQKKRLEDSLRELSPQIELQQGLRWRLKLAAEVLEKRPSLGQKLGQIMSSFPIESVVNNVRVKKSKTEINGTIFTLPALAEFEKKLVMLNKEREYSLVKINSLVRGGNGWNFTLELKREQ